jgi:hypothetical protein
MKKTISCPLCEAGIPRKVTVPIWDETTKTFTYHTMSEKTYNKLYGEEVKYGSK